MKHAGDAALDALEPLLREMRRLSDLNERKRGIFYCKRDAFLHFHEGAAELFADLKSGGEYRRFRVSTTAGRKAFLTAAKKAAVA